MWFWGSIKQFVLMVYLIVIESFPWYAGDMHPGKKFNNILSSLVDRSSPVVLGHQDDRHSGKDMAECISCFLILMAGF